MISVSVYRTPKNKLYAAVWGEPGPDWSAVHGVDAAGYQHAFATNTAAGYEPVLLAVTGAASSAVFA